MHAAKLGKSGRLLRVAGVLEAAGAAGVTSWELMQLARVVAPGTCVAELRAQGYAVTCKREGSAWRYTLGGR